LPIDFYLVRLENDDRPAFDCGDTDLNEFFLQDSINYNKQLISITYAAMCSKTDEVLGFFSVSNDSVRKEDAPTKSALKRCLRNIKREKRFNSTPAVKIGRLAVCESTKGQGLGTQLMDFIKVFFTSNNKTGCRFIIVDSYDAATRFYELNGFKFLGAKDTKNKTHLMYFDLINFVQ